VLGDGARHLHNGRLLEPVRANQLARHLACGGWEEVGGSRMMSGVYTEMRNVW
jgi:hypothetical protein